MRPVLQERASGPCCRDGGVGVKEARLGGGLDRAPQPVGFCAPFLLHCRLPEPQPRHPPPVQAGWCFVRELGARQPGRGEPWRSPDQPELGPCPVNGPSLSKLACLRVGREGLRPGRWQPACAGRPSRERR